MDFQYKVICYSESTNKKCSPSRGDTPNKNTIKKVESTNKGRYNSEKEDNKKVK